MFAVDSGAAPKAAPSESAAADSKGSLLILDVLNKKGRPSVTSDRWHVVHARCTGEPVDHPRFERTILSEHEDRTEAADAARIATLASAKEMAGLEPERRDQIFVRQPNYKSLKLAGRKATRE
jgi:hypothetical protein